MAQPGDILLVQSLRPGYRLGRRLMGAGHDHVSVVIGGGQTLNIVHPRAVLTPLDRMLSPERAPVLLRPAWPSEEARAAFVADLERLREAPYDLLRGVSLVWRMFLLRTLGVRWPLRKRREGPRYICTDAMLLHLDRHLPGFTERIQALPLALVQLGSASADDFLVIARRQPDLLRLQPLQ